MDDRSVDLHGDWRIRWKYPFSNVFSFNYWFYISDSYTVDVLQTK